MTESCAIPGHSPSGAGGGVGETRQGGISPNTVFTGCGRGNGLRNTKLLTELFAAYEGDSELNPSGVRSPLDHNNSVNNLVFKGYGYPPRALGLKRSRLSSKKFPTSQPIAHAGRTFGPYGLSAHKISKISWLTAAVSGKRSAQCCVDISSADTAVLSVPFLGGHFCPFKAFFNFIAKKNPGTPMSGMIVFYSPINRFVPRRVSPSGLFPPMQFPMAKQTLSFFEGHEVRKSWDDGAEKWYFSVVDIIAVLTDSPNPAGYWRVLKKRLLDEGNETVTKCNGLKLLAADGKMRTSDVLDTEGILRLIQSIPSKNAEPFKIWLARVGRERIDEIDDPELAINRAMKTYERKGYSKEWTNLRLKSIDVRKELTNEWENRGVKQGHEFAILTDDITQAWAGMTTKEYKGFKDLKQESLRDNMSNVELVLNMLAEVSTTEISKAKQPETFPENRRVAKEGGAVAGKARRALESQTGKSVITSQKFSGPKIADNQSLDKSQKLGDGETGSHPLPLPPN